MTTAITVPVLPLMPMATPELHDVPLSEAELCDWVANAPGGERAIYYRGHLSVDRTPSPEVLNEDTRRKLNLVAKRAMQLAEDGLVLLVQRRLATSDYAYIAIRAFPIAQERQSAMVVSAAA